MSRTCHSPYCAARGGTSTPGAGSRSCSAHGPGGGGTRNRTPTG
jgi:hypothetical protein